MPQEELMEQTDSGSAAQTIRLNSSEAQDSEAQIAEQLMTDEIAERYFGCSGMRFWNKPYATAAQIVRLSHKHRYAVKGLNQYRDSLDILGDREAAEQLIVPEPAVCEFCGAKLEYLGVLDRKTGNYDWSVRQWSAVPMRCGCTQAAAKWEAQEAEERRLAEEERRQREETARKERVERQLAQSGMKPRFLSRTFANFQCDTAGRTKAYRAAKEYADNFAAHRANGDGLYIEGTFGTGKTHLAAAIAIQLMEQGHSVIFRTADDLLREIKATFDESGREEQKVMERLKKCDLLVIDDIGKEQATDWSTAQLYAIINDRYESQKPLVITTNFNENDLIAVESPKGVGEHRIRAILSRLHEICGLMTMNWQDWRGMQ